MGYIALGDLISKAQVEKCGKREYPVLSMTMHDGIVFQNDRFKKDIASIDRSNYSVVGFNQLVVSFPIDEGVLAVQDITNAGIVSPAYKIWNIDQAKLVPKYLEMWLRSPRSIDYYKSKLRGTTARRRSIPEEDFLGMRVNVLPMEEQERIVDLLTRVKGVMLLREQELVALDELIKARFVEMFGLDDSPTKSLNNVIVPDSSISYGIIVPGDYFENGCPMVRPSDYKKGQLDLKNVYRVDPIIEQQYTRTRLHGDEILVQVIGQPGQIIPTTEECRGMNVTRNLAVIRPNSQIVSREYLIEFLRSETAQCFLTGSSKQSTLKQLPLGLLKKLEVPIPPMKLQKRFANFVSQIDKSKSAIQKSLDETQLLFDSLMQQYFG